MGHIGAGFGYGVFAAVAMAVVLQISKAMKLPDGVEGLLVIVVVLSFIWVNRIRYAYGTTFWRAFLFVFKLMPTSEEMDGGGDQPDAESFGEPLDSDEEWVGRDQETLGKRRRTHH